MSSPDAIPITVPTLRPPHFTIHSVRSTPTTIRTLSWCRCMDLVALVTEHGTVEIYRLSFERLCTIELDTPCTTATIPYVIWRPDGKALLVITENGDAQMISVEARKVVMTLPA